MLGVYEWSQALIVGLIFILDYLILRRVSRRSLPWWWLTLATILVVMINKLLSLGATYWLNALVLLLLVRVRYGPKSWLEALFCSFYAWGLTDLMIHFLTFVVFPMVLGFDLTSLSPPLPLLLVSGLLVYPIYLLVHYFIDFNYFSLGGKQGSNKQSQGLLMRMTLSFLVYGLIMEGLFYFSGFISGSLIPNYAQLVTLVAIGFFFGMISYANRKLKDRLFQELEEEQERHFQSLREANQHILRLHRELARGSLYQLEKNEEVALVETAHGEVRNVDEKLIKQLLPDISHICSEVLRSVIESKFLEARAKGVTLVLEAPDQVQKPEMDPVDLSLVLQYFLDIGLMLVDRENEGVIRLSLGQNEVAWYMVVEVTVSGEAGDLFEADDAQVTMKQVESLVQAYPEVKLRVTSEHQLVTQILEC